MSDGNLSRREYVTQGAAAAALAAGLAGCIGGGNGDDETSTLEYGAIATADAGDWSDFEDETGWELSFSTISNTPGELLSTLVAGGGRELYDVLGPVGGIQPPLASEGAIQPVDTDRLDNWDAQYDYWETDQGRDFISHDGDIYGIPIVWQGDSIAYLPDEVGEITSYGALFDEEYAGQVAIEDNYTTAGQKTAMYLDHHDIEDIEDPRNMTASEFETVVDFLIEQKESGQFRTMWSGYENAVNLMSNGEVVVMDTWEPVVFDLRDQGVNAEYAEPEEGYLLWALADYVVRPEEERSDAREEAIYDFLDWNLAGWYGATITQQTGYMTNPAAIEYAEESDEFDADEIREIHEGVSERFEVGGSWQQRWPDEREVYEEQWERLRSA
ncbi:PotD/PotF family extracellular solute-binding protein [Natronomonas gomsonensis]|uniref:ABC transporter substrate-binding protein n=1 Tax=Natronomonas gomsonensis TaxID=1046043 RepID=UPI0015B85249|nr:extracellular solute-binding protein [Natronomonas gomsonensis]